MCAWRVHWQGAFQSEVVASVRELQETYDALLLTQVGPWV